MEMKTVTTEFLNHKRQYDAENELIAKLEANPMSKGQVIEMLSRGYTEYEQAQNNNKFAELVQQLEDRGLIVPDSKKSFDQFVSENPGILCLHQSSLQQMDIEEYEKFSNVFKYEYVALHQTSKDQRRYKSYKIYNDMPLDLVGQVGDWVRHYSYDKNGQTLTSGKGYLVRTEFIDLKTEPEKKKFFMEAERLYTKARNEIDDRFKRLNL
jgi:hypothetical protein